MIIKRWNAKARMYEPCELPDDWKVSCYETDMGKRVNCVGCGEEIAFGDAYTSRLFHTELGFGYAVCEKCHRYELEGESR